MPDINNTVWNLAGVPDLPRDKQVEILTRLQNRIHQLYDALVLAEEFLEANMHYSEDMKPVYDALGKKRE